MSPADSVSTTAVVKVTRLFYFYMTWMCVHFSLGHRDALEGGKQMEAA